MYRFFAFVTVIFASLLAACAGSEPVPEPGMEVIQHGHGEEMQVATDVDWNDYTKIILHAAPVEFRENWKSDQERLHGKEIRNEDVKRIENAVSGQLSKVMYKTLSGKGGYEMTSESGDGVMVFQPNIVDLDVQAAGWVQNSILESLPAYRGGMTIELVIRDSVSDKLLAVAWQRQSDPYVDDMDNTANFSNALAFRTMSKTWADWLLKQLDKARSGTE
jgi:hypothetical protein